MEIWKYSKKDKYSAMAIKLNSGYARIKKRTLQDKLRAVRRLKGGLK